MGRHISVSLIGKGRRGELVATPMFAGRRSVCKRAALKTLTLSVLSGCLAFLAGACGSVALVPGQDTTERPDRNETVVSGDEATPVVSSSDGVATFESDLSFQVSRTFCCDPLRLRFEMIAPESVLRTAASVQWTFGDGHSGHGFTLEHMYPWPGTYLVELTVIPVEQPAMRSRAWLTLAVDAGHITVDLVPAESAGEAAPDAPLLLAEAGPGRTVESGTIVWLDGRSSHVPNGVGVRWEWTQIEGVPVTILAADQAVATVEVPSVDVEATLIFRLTVQNEQASDMDDVTITVRPAALESRSPYDHDEDGDGLPDRWELRFFGTIETYGAEADPDADGTPNRDEFRARTNPLRSDRMQYILAELDRAIRAFYAEGARYNHVADGALVGWPMRKTVDGRGPTLWGVDDHIDVDRPVISVMGPGTPHAGVAFLRAYRATGNRLYLEYATDVARTLLSIQRDMALTARGEPQPPELRGGWINHALVIVDTPDTRATIPDEIGHWTTARLDESEERLVFVSREKAYMAFDDSISTDAAMFLLEFAEVAGGAQADDADAEAGVQGLSPTEALAGADAFFRLAEYYRTQYAMARGDFEDVTFVYDGTNRAKDGPHPFVTYLEGLPAHPLSRGEPFFPYADGGLPHGAGRIEDMVLASGSRYGAKAAGYVLHKTVNDHVMSRFILFLLRYYQATGDPAALDSLEVQLAWLARVFEMNGNRAWCQQYHVLDDVCAPARPFEPPALAMRESVKLIRHLALLERTLEAHVGREHPSVRRALEDAVYYIRRVIPRDEPRRLFQYYALDAYSDSSAISGYPSVAPNEPVFTCDFYYPADPFTPCSDPYGDRTFHLFRIDEATDGEFTAPNGHVWLSDVGDGALELFLIDDQCLDDPARTDFRGCLNLHKPYALDRDYYAWGKHYWGVWESATLEAFRDEWAPNHAGLWTADVRTDGTLRTIARTDDFVHHVIAITRLIVARGGVSDRDADGLSDHVEAELSTDPAYPDTDRDGLLDGDEVYRFGTSPIEPDTDGDGCIDSIEVNRETDPLVADGC